MGHDWLNWYLKRVPADETLVRAMEARLIDALDLPESRLDLRDDFGRFAPPPPPSETQYDAILSDRQTVHNLLANNGLLVLFTDEEAETQLQSLQEDGFEIVRWQRYFDTDAARVSAELSSPWPQRWFDLIGHYVPLPWAQFLHPLEQHLRPQYDRFGTRDGQRLLIVARKSAETPVEQELPPAKPITWDADKPEETEPNIPAESTLAPTKPSQHPSPSVRIQRPALSHSTWLGILLGVVLISTFFAQRTMQFAADTPGRGIGLWLVALAALFGISRLTVGDNRTSFSQSRFSLDSQTIVDSILYLASLGLALLAYTQTNRPIIALPLWLLGIVGAGYALYKPQPTDDSASQAPFTTRSYLLIGILVTALLLRYIGLTEHPFVINGIEAQLGLDALAARNVFGVGWLTNPTLPLYLQKTVIGVFGRTPLALRFLSPLIGTVGVFAIYHIGTRLWNQRTGLLAALFLAGSHTHIHYSRLGMTNIYDPLLTLLAIGGLAAAWHSNSRSAWLGAGGALGLCAYIFTAAHLVPLMLIAFLGYLALTQTEKLPENSIGLLTALLFAAVIAAPQMRFYQQNSDLFMERSRVLGIFQNGWLEQEAVATGETEGQIFGRTLWTAIVAFPSVTDRDSSYNPGLPLLNTFTGMLFLLGLGMSLFHLKQPRYAALFFIWLITIIFGGALLVELPHSRRLLIALPAVLLLSARALDWLLEKIVPANFSIYALRAALVVGLLAGLLDVSFYFGRYRDSAQFGDRNTEIAFETTQYLNALDGEWTAWFHGAPSMYINFSTIPFLTTDFEAGLNLHDALTSTGLPAALTANTTHIFTPDRLDDLARLQTEFPGGTITPISGRFADPLIVVYELTSP